jgi:hypothetical protein
MTAEEILLIRDLRRALDRLPIDYSRVEISLSRGHVALAGTVKTLRSQPLVNLKDEMDSFERKFQKDSRVKSLHVACRLVIPEKKENQHFGEDPTVHSSREQ